jgi:hypothetical protein
MASGRVSKAKGKILDIPTSPTIGTATAGMESASVAFTANSSGKGGPTFSYTALSNPDSVTANGTSSPITVTGLTSGTSYTFTVRGNNPTGSSEYTSASNSVTVLDSTVMLLDAGNSSSYPGTGTTWTDISGNSKNISLSNCTYGGSGTGGYLTFNGSNSYGALGSSLFGAPTSNSFSISVWIYANSNPTSAQEWVSQWTSGNSGQSLFFGPRGFSSGNVSMYITDGTAATGLPYSTGVWANWVCVNDVTNNNAYIYKNGSLVATIGAKSSASGVASLFLGRQGSLDGEYYDGRMAIVQGWSQAINSTKITAHFNTYKNRYGL